MLSSQQQDVAFGALFPALVAGERLIELCKSEPVSDEVAGLQSQLAQCVTDILRIMGEVEEGHSRMTGTGTDELDFIIDYLAKEVRSLGSRLRSALALSRRLVR